MLAYIVILVALIAAMVLGMVFGGALTQMQIERELQSGECRIGRCTYLVKGVEFAPAPMGPADTR